MAELTTPGPASEQPLPRTVRIALAHLLIDLPPGRVEVIARPAADPDVWTLDVTAGDERRSVRVLDVGRDDDVATIESGHAGGKVTVRRPRHSVRLEGPTGIRSVAGARTPSASAGTAAQPRPRRPRLVETHFDELEPKLIAELQKMHSDGETPVVLDSLAQVIREKFTGDPKLLEGWTTLSAEEAERHELRAGEVGFVFNFAWLAVVGWDPPSWRKIDSPDARFLVFGFGKGGSGFRGVFRQANSLRGIYTFTTTIREPPRPGSFCEVIRPKPHPKAPRPRGTYVQRPPVADGDRPDPAELAGEIVRGRNLEERLAIVNEANQWEGLLSSTLEHVAVLDDARLRTFAMTQLARADPQRLARFGDEVGIVASSLHALTTFPIAGDKVDPHVWIDRARSLMPAMPASVSRDSFARMCSPNPFDRVAASNLPNLDDNVRATLLADPIRIVQVAATFVGDSGDGGECLECGSSYHSGDGGYDCLFRSSNWLIRHGIVLTGRAMDRTLGRAWPAEFRSELTVDVRLNSSKYGKYSRVRNRIYESFVIGVPARKVANGVVRISQGLNADAVRGLIDECREHIWRSEMLPAEAFGEFVSHR